MHVFASESISRDRLRREIQLAAEPARHAIATHNSKMVGPKPVIWNTGAFVFALSRTLGRSWNTWKHNTGGLGVLAWIFHVFGASSELRFERLLGAVDKHMFFVHFAFQVVSFL